MPTARDELGRKGEDEAARHLKSLGYRIVGRRERVLRGDIYIVAIDCRTVVFVEVRSRPTRPMATLRRRLAKPSSDGSPN